jgi:hypothetical protein
MTERRKDLIALLALLVVLILFFSKILITDKIIRAPDIVQEYFWNVKDLYHKNFFGLFHINLDAGWNNFINSGYTLEGGGESTQFLFLSKLIYYFIPPPASVAWFIVAHLFLGAGGTYLYCRAIGASCIAAFLGGLIFAVAPENASLINAGHVLKIATISVAPWAFYFLEKGFQKRRVIFFLTAGLVLAFQFFYTHWQIAYYTCLGVGLYGIARLIGIILSERNAGKGEISRLVWLNLVVLFFFLSTVAISLAPLASWSRDTNRGVQSGANQGKGGLDREEAMSWSLPPEEVVSFVIPGMFGFSRQEGGENPANIASYYWGRMRFTQTTDYMGLLPWLLLPLPLMFRRDRYTWIALFALAAGLVFSMGKYTFVYNALFDYFPGINRFRVPKMIMFLPVLGLGVLAARGLDVLLDEEARQTRNFRRYLYGLLALPALILVMLGIELAGKDYWLNSFYEWFAQPTRYEQDSQKLLIQRWDNLVFETGIAFAVAALYAAAIYAYSRKWFAVKVIPLVLLALYLADVGRVNSKFMFLVDMPQKAKGITTPVMEYLLSHGSNQYRVLPMDGTDPMQYSAQRIPVMFTSQPVQQVRWQNFIEAFVLNSSMPDVMNVKYLIYGTSQYEQEKTQLGGKFQPVFRSPDGTQTVLENKTVLPKGWLVPAVYRTNDYRQALGALQDPAFDPRKAAIVETGPPFPLADPNNGVVFNPDSVVVTKYEGNYIVMNVKAPQNALLVIGEKYYRGWKARVDGKPAEIMPVDYLLRGVYLQSGDHKVEFVFDPLLFKIGKWLTLISFVFYALMMVREWLIGRREVKGEGLS